MNFIRQWFLGLVAVIAVPTPALAGQWHRAESAHFLIYSDGSKSDLAEFTQDLEKFDALLRKLWNMPDREGQPKLTVYTVSDGDDVGIFTGISQAVGIYRPTVEGSFAIANRQHTREKNALSGLETLYHEYAHHFYFNNFSIPAPPWFVEGFAEFVATAEFTRNGQWYFGKPAFHRAAEIEYFGNIPVRDLLTSSDSLSKDAFYGWAWALTHMLYSKEEGRGAKIVAYLNLLNRGKEPLAAAQEAFGDLDQLDSRLRSYVKQRMEYSKSNSPIAYGDDIAITALSEAEGEVVHLTMMRRGGGKFDQALDELRQLGAAPQASADLLYQLGRAEFSFARGEYRRKGDAEEEADDEAGDGETGGDAAIDYSASEAAVDRALALASDHVKANTLKARILIERLAEGDDETEADWELARRHALAANHEAPNAAWPLYVFAQSYLRQGRMNPDVSPAIASAFELAPEAQDVRIAYAFDLASQRKFASAIRIATVLANDPHGGATGKRILAQIKAMQAGVPYLDIPEVPANEAE